jgi:hypothetical protein
MSVRDLKLVWAAAVLLLAVSASAGEPYDERMVVEFDGREWVAAHCDADNDRMIVEYLVNGESPENWTELVTTNTFPVRQEPGAMALLKDFYHSNVTKNCALARWEELYNSDSMSICVWDLEACLGPDSTEYSLVGFFRGVQYLHAVVYACRNKGVFEQKLPLWKEIFMRARASAPDESLSPPGDLLADSTRMIRATYRMENPSWEPGSFVTLPKKLWRSGTRFARGEERPDVAKGVHGLLISNEPDMWMINLFDNSCKHAVDPGPTYNTLCPVFGELKQDGLGALEFGREEAFFTYYGARWLVDDTIDSVVCEVYELPRWRWLLRLYVRKDTGLPHRVTRRSPDGNVEAVAYDEYVCNLDLDTTLFVPPENVTMSEN